jgi:choline kinase
MKKPLAIILAAGVGRRFGEALSGQPKALLEVEGETLLVRLIRQLRLAGVEEIVVVAGFGIEAIRGAVDSRVQVLLNPDYERGAILSLYTAREFFGRDLLVMDADVFGPDEMLARLVDSPKESCFLLDGRAEASGEEQMLHVRGDRVWDIARDPRGEYDLLGESVGFLKVSAAASPKLLELLAARVERGEIDLEHEEVYPDFLEQTPVGFERVDDLAWTEIDFPEDLERARLMAREFPQG